MSIPKDEPDRCVFHFSDGRRCSMPGFPGDMGLCYYHAHKHRHLVSAEQFGALISEHLNHDALTASDLTAGFATLFRATAMGHIKPKTTIALTHLGQLLFRTQQHAKQEFRDAFKTPWNEVVQESLIYNLPEAEDSANPQTAPSSEAADDTAGNPSGDSSDAPANPRTKIM